ncbi:hypothetical protein CL653_03490 [bacterium]|nr:hypothetical protein [bacterium]|tara:strand:- start:29 stop:343 length:315 start_codon:yes stop_codon:yes gene_type:complete
MANGRLGASSPSADTDTILYTCPASTVATVTVSVARRSSTASEKVRIALMDSTIVGDLANEDYLEYDSTVTEITGIVLSANESIVVRTDAATVSFVAYGFEEAE